MDLDRPGALAGDLGQVQGQHAAVELGLSVATVETHRRQIASKLDIHSVAELTKFAIREGLTSLDD